MHPPHTSTSAASVLAQLRAFTQRPVARLEDLRRATRQQAALFHACLAAPLHQLPKRLNILTPSIHIKYVSNIPLAGISFWARNRWHIHVRASDALHEQVLTILKELKRIIDHPLHGRLDHITGYQWEELAVQFADDVVALAQSTQAATAR